MRAYLWSVGYWLIVNGTTTAPTDLAELAKWTLLDSMANGAIELRCSLNICDLIGNMSALMWTALSTAFGVTGVQTCALPICLWLIVSGTTTAPTDPAELAKWTLSDSMANGAIELRDRKSVV